MSHEEAIAVVARPLCEVEESLANIESWPSFIMSMQELDKVGSHRYRAVVHSGAKSQREVTIAVIHDSRAHRLAWKAVSGPRYEGEIRLNRVDEARTRVRLSVTADPVGFGSALSEMLSPHSNDHAILDLERLEAHLTTR